MDNQFADDSMTPDPISVSRNQYKDEIPTDRPEHANATPEHSNPMYSGRQYAPSPMGGSSVEAAGVSKESVDLNVTAARRGAEN